MFGGDLIFDGYIVAKFSNWLQAPGPTWVYPGFDLDNGAWCEGQKPPPNKGPGIIDLEVASRIASKEI